jgi:hypothetical protein
MRGIEVRRRRAHICRAVFRGKKSEISNLKFQNTNRNDRLRLTLLDSHAVVVLTLTGAASGAPTDVPSYHASFFSA